MNINSEKIISINKNIQSNKFLENSLNPFSLYKNIVECSPDCIAVLNENHEYLDINDSYSHLSGKKRESIIGQSVSSTFSDNQYKEVIKPNLEKCIDKSVPVIMNLHIYDNKNCKKIINASCVSSVTNHKKKIIFMYCRDITSQYEEFLESQRRNRNHPAGRQSGALVA